MMTECKARGEGAPEQCAHGVWAGEQGYCYECDKKKTTFVRCARHTTVAYPQGGVCHICDELSGRRTVWENQGRKDDGDKTRMDLLDAEAIEVLSDVLTFGAKKYAPNNWRKGIKLSRLLGALLRHAFAIMRGEDNDPETGLPHAGHAMCCCMFLIWTMKHKPEMDDRNVNS